MWNPNCYGDPGKVTDPKYYCFTGDSGGVHYNSAIPNHAFALMADGGSYNGRDIAGIGLTKAVHIFWNSLLMLTPVSGFADQADALEASCSSLTGINLPALSTNVTNAGASGEIISAGDCNEVQAVVDAVELRITPTQCGFDTVLETEPPVRCLDKGELQRISLTDWETGLGSWAVGRHDVANPATFSTADWAVVSVLPGERSGSAAFVADLIEGNCEDDDETGALTLDSPGIEIPGNVVTPRLSIDHWMASELKWDGGNLKISVNSGPFTLVPASAFDVGPYNSSLYVARNSDINTNPLAGEAAFTGTDEGTSDGSWGQSQLDLSGIAGAGDVIRLRFDFGQDGCNGVTGWYVDEVEFFSCSLEQLSLNCGNGVLDGDEQCDDGNKLVGDGCSGSCRVEPGWQCSEEAVTTALLSAPDAENSVQNTGAMSVLSDSAVSSEVISICIDTRPAVIFSDGFED
jgi:cysteine-rich repeat protein